MEFQVLGPVAVIDRGAPTDIGGPRQRRLLAALEAHANHAVSTDALIEIVFEGTPPAGATTTIRTYVARLRKALGEASGVRIETVPHGYMLCVDAHLIDANRFEAEVELGRRQLADNDPLAAAETLRRALGHWRGQAYGAFGAEDWVRGEVARLDELRVDAEGLLVDAQLASGLADAVIPELRRLIDAHPVRERFRGQLMLALHRTGRHAEALRTFEDYRAELIELGLEPSAELIGLERSVAAHDPALQLTAPAGRALRGYRLGGSLGAGRQGEVFRAVQPVVGREVAIKVIRAEVADSPAFIRRFDARAQAVSKLEHAHIVPLYDYWREPRAAYLVNRLMPDSLRDRLELGPLDLDEVASLIRQIGSALFSAHRAGVVHSDVRPSNVLLDAEGNFYLSDFRLPDVDLAEVDAAEPTGFEAPEVRGWQRPVPGSDQFGFAILIAYALTGVLPFGRRGIASPDDHFPSVHGHRPSVPAAVDDVLWRATAWDPGDRYDDVMAFTDELTAALGAPMCDRSDDRPVNPFRGLAAFTEADAAWFFGRDDVIDDVLRRLGPGGAPLVTVIGASGSGKSSVVRAGVVPRLRHGAVAGASDWLITTMVPGEHPTDSLTAAVRSIATVDDGEAARSVSTIVQRAVAPETSVLLVIDQMEELFTLTPPAEAEAFIDELTDALAPDRPQLRVLATLRADFSDRPLQHSRFGRLVADGTVPLVAMNVVELDQAIREPARRAGVEVEPALVSELIADLVDQPSALPLLQFTLTQLFERCSGHAMTLAAYQTLGGVDAAVARRADEVFDGLSSEEQAGARRLFLRLVAIDEAGNAARRRVTKVELGELGNGTDALDRLLESFGSARLLAFDRDQSTREPTVELAHESLITQWPRLREWVTDAGEGLRVRGQLTAATRQWIDGGSDDGDLYRGGRLEVALAWADDQMGSITTTESEFLRVSAAARDAVETSRRAHLALQARANRRLRALVAWIGIALVVALVAGGLAVWQRNRADEHARRAQTRELVAASESSLDIDPELSVLLALETIGQSDDETLAEAVEALHHALLEHRTIASVPIGTTQAADTSFSSDGARFATIGEDPNTADVWSTSPIRKQLTLEGHTGQVTAVEFSPDGARIATTGTDGTVRVWDASTGEAVALHEPPASFSFGDPAMWRVTFSPDGSALAASFVERTLIWNVDTGESFRLRASGAPAWFWETAVFAGVAFHPDGSLLATTQNSAEPFPSADPRGPRVLLWDLESKRLVRELDGHAAAVTDVVFSPDGRLLYSASRDGTIGIWDVEHGTLAGSFRSHDSAVLSVDVSAGGDRVVSSDATSALVWDASTLEIEARLVGHDGPVESVEFAPDGTSILTGSRVDGTVRLWSVDEPSEAVTLPGRADTNAVSVADSSLAFTPEGDLMVARSDELITWTIPDGRHIATLQAPGSAVSSITSDSGGTLVAATGDDGVVVYDVASGDVVARPFIGIAASSTTFAPDGQRIVSTGPGAKLTDLATGRDRSLVRVDAWTYDAEFSPDGTELVLAYATDLSLSSAAAVAGDAEGVIEVLDAETLATVATIELGPSETGHTDRVVDVEYSPDGSLLATASKDASAIVWNPDGYEPVWRLVGHTSELTAVDFDPDGDRVATASLDGTVKIWDLDTGRNVLTLPNDRAVSDVAFAPDGRYLAAVEPSGQAIVYFLDTDELVAEARRRVTRDLTTAECVQYLHTETCSRG